MANWGKREFSIKDMVGDVVMYWWASRRLATLDDWARRLVKLAVLVLVIVTLVHVLYPTQRAGWILWLGEEKSELAHWTAVSLVGFTALMLPSLRYAYDHGARKLAWGAGAFTAIMLITVLMGTWNYYAFASGRAVGVAEAASGGAAARIAEAEAALAQLNARAAQNQARFDSELARTPASYASARARIMRAATEAQNAQDRERGRLESELRQARAANVNVQGAVADPRPIDRFMAGCWAPGPCKARHSVAIGLDLQRSAVFEFIALIGVALGAAAALAPSRLHAADTGAPLQPLAERLRVEDKRSERPVRVDRDAIRSDYAAAVQAEIEAEFTDASASESARKGWITRLRKRQALKRAAEAQAPVGASDARVARSAPQEKGSAAAIAAAAAALSESGLEAPGEPDFSEALAQAIVHASAADAPETARAPFEGSGEQSRREAAAEMADA